MDESTNENLNEISQEDKKMRRRAKSKVKKEETKRLREEEIRRKLYESKDQRVRLVQRRDLERFQLNSSDIKSKSTNLSSAYLVTEDFPNLGSDKHKNRFITKKKVHDPLDANEPVHPTCSTGKQCATDCHLVGPEMVVLKDPPQTGILFPHVDGIGNLNVSETETSQCTVTSAAKTQQVKPKRADPIKVNLLSFLKQKKSAAPSEIKVPQGVIKKKTILSGNPLDSSNPERKKGKMRESAKPPKPTRLKAIILKDRIANAELRKASMQNSVNSKSFAIGEFKIENTCTFVQNQNFSLTEQTQDNSEAAQIDCVTTFQVEPVNINNIGNITEDTPIMKPLKEETDKVNISNNPTESIHGRKFREYCDHMLSKDLDNVVKALVKDIVKFQDRQYFSDPIKAHAKRRFVLGFRETKKYLSLKKVKLVIIAPDMESIQSEGGIYDIIKEVKEICKSQEVPYVFATSRTELRKLTNKSCKVKGISCIGIINYDGSQDNVKVILSLLAELQLQYRKLQVNHGEPSVATNTQIESPMFEAENDCDVNQQVVASFLEKLTKELENTSLCE